MSNENSPSADWISKEAPNPMRKLNNCPENTPDTAVEALPLFAKVVIDI